MRILCITAGTGSYHCGSCMRDHALARAFLAAGHQAQVLGLYMPMVLEEEPASDCPLFLGGINAWLQHHVALFRRTPAWLDRIFDWRPLLAVVAKRSGMTNARDLASLTVDTLRGRHGHQRKEFARLARWIQANGPYDVIILGNLLLVGLAEALRSLRPQPCVLVTLQGEDSFCDQLPAAERAQAYALMAEGLDHCQAALAVSASHRQHLCRRLQCADARVHVVYNGIDFEGFALAPLPARTCIGFLAHLAPIKGLHLVVEAFVRYAQAGGQAELLLVGSCASADQAFVAEQERKLKQAGLGGRYRWLCNVSRAEKQTALQQMTLLSVPAQYEEAFGLYQLEAWASGVPTCQPRRGAFPELAALTGCGHIYAPGEDEASALASAWEAMLDEAAAWRQRVHQAQPLLRQRFSLSAMAQGVLDLVPKGSA